MMAVAATSVSLAAYLLVNGRLAMYLLEIFWAGHTALQYERSRRVLLVVVLRIALGLCKK